MNTETEIAELKKEVACLRREMNELRQFIQYHPPDQDDDGKPATAYLTIRCSIISVVNPSEPGETQIHLVGSRLGSFISVIGKDEKSRIVLQVEKGAPEVSLFDKAGKCGASLRLENGSELNLFGSQGKLGAMMRVGGDEERGEIGVCEAGKPRAIMKATETGGCISAVHDDGLTRITMVSSEASGDLMTVTPDMKVGVKISSNGLDGGYIAVNRANGVAGVILSNTVIGGVVMVQDHQGNITGALPSIGSGE